MTTFSLAASATGSYADPASHTTVFTPVAGDFIIILVSDRSGTTHVDHAVTVNGTATGTLTKLGGEDNQIGDSNYRHTLSAWLYDIQTDDAFTTISGDDGTANAKRMSYFVVNPSDSGYVAAMELKEIKFGKSETADWNNLDSGNTGSLSGDNDLCEIALASCRTSTDVPVTTSFDAQTGDHTAVLGGSNNITQVFAMEASGQANGVKAANINSDGSGNEGICCILVFGPAAAGGTHPVNPLGHALFGPLGGPL